MAIKTRGVNHPGIMGKDRDEMVKFYTEVLGMRLVLDHPNLDEPCMQHLFFDAGNGGFIAYFVINEGTDLELPKAKDYIGHMGHFALNPVGTIEDDMEKLNNHGVKFMCSIDRRYERSVYFKDPNGVLVELRTLITPLPEGANEAEVVAPATALRAGKGAHRIEDNHVRRAMQGMGYALGSQ